MSPSERIERIIKECSGVWGTSGVSSWEKDRLHEWRGRDRLSENQLRIVEAVEKKVFGDDD